jgi:hypothetical protein
MRFGKFLATVSCVALSACGGDGGPGDNPPPVVALPPTPVPPTPPPPPPPPVTIYGSPRDYANGFSFTTGIGYSDSFFAPETGGIQDIQVTFLEPGQTAGFAFTPTPEMARFTYGADVHSYSVDQRFSDLTAVPVQYRAGGSILSLDTYNNLGYVNLAIYYPPPGPTETRNGVAGRSGGSQLILFGPPTAASDALPPILNYRQATSGFSFPPGPVYDLLLQGLSIDTASNSVSGTVLVRSQAPNFPTIGTLTLSGTLDPQTRILSGTLTDAQSGYSGNFRAQLFGPKGTQMGMLLQVNKNGAVAVYGYLIAGT